MSVKLLFTFPLLLLKSFKDVITSLRLLIFSIIPIIVAIIVFSISSYYLQSNIESLSSYIYVSSYSFINFFLNLIVAIINIFISAILALIAMNVLGGYFIEESVVFMLKKHEILDLNSQRLTFKRSIRFILDESFKLFLVLTCCIISLVLGFIPIITLFSFIIIAFLLGLQGVDLVLSLAEKNYKEKIAIYKKNVLAILCIGAYYSLVLLIPFVGMFFLPLIYFSIVKAIDSNYIDITP